MKYKRLTNEELKALENEFIHFLASAQITGADWVKMKESELEKAEELIDVFSDVVYDRVLRKIKYLEYRDSKTLNIFYCAEDKISLVGLRVKEGASLDLTQPDSLQKWQEGGNNVVNLIKSEKTYTREREEEVFELLQNGCLITDEKLFTVLMDMAG